MSRANVVDLLPRSSLVNALAVRLPSKDAAVMTALSKDKIEPARKAVELTRAAVAERAAMINKMSPEQVGEALSWADPKCTCEVSLGLPSVRKPLNPWVADQNAALAVNLRANLANAMLGKANAGRRWQALGEMALGGRKTTLASMTPETRSAVFALMSPLDRAKALNSMSPSHRSHALRTLSANSISAAMTTSMCVPPVCARVYVSGASVFIHVCE